MPCVRLREMIKILLVQGANLTFLGRREPAIYGTTTSAELDAMLQRHAAERGYSLEIFYSNIEGEAINRIYRAVEPDQQALRRDFDRLSPEARDLRFDYVRPGAPPCLHGGLGVRI